MGGYVDIHSHILYGVDDGSQSLDESVQMLSMAYEEGVRVMYVTPHYGSGKEKYNSDSLVEKFNELSDVAKGIGDEGIKLILGNEITYSSSAVEDLKCGKARTMGDTRYVLLEFDYEVSFKEMYKGLSAIINAGYRPILAHIERYYCLNKNYNDILSLRELGVALQINTSSVMTKFSAEAKFCRKLIREGYIHFLGSDCHRVKWRAPLMKQAVEVIKKKTPERYLERILFTNPERLQNNQFL